MNGALVLDVVLEFAASFDEGGFGDVKFFGDASEAPAELHEALLGGEVIHAGELWQLVWRWGSETM